MSVLFTGGTSGAVANVTDYNNNWNLLEASLFDLGPFLISGLAVTAGTGLSVNVALGVASIGGQVSSVAGFSIGGLTPSTTNHLYLLQNGTGTANTTGTAPALSVKLGTCATGVGTVTSVDATHASGRQTLVRHENLVPGGGAGHPASINLANWAVAAADGVPVYGVLPSGALPADTDSLSALTDVTLSGTAQGDLLYRDASAWQNLAHGTAGQVLQSGGAAANPSWMTLPTSVSGDLTLAPSTFTRNLMTTAAGAMGLGITANASQTANLIYTQSSTGTGWFIVGPAGQVVLGEGINIAAGTTTGTQIGAATSQKIGFWAKTPVVQQNLTGVKSGGTALTNLIALLVTIGVLTDSTT